MNTTTRTFLIILFAFALSPSYAQCNDWDWPEDKNIAAEKVTLLQDAIMNKKYKQGIKPLNWLLENTPNINSSIYVHGATIYDELANREKAPLIKKRYVDSLMAIYELRVRYCGQKDYISNRKATSAFKYYINNADVVKVLPLMDSAFAINKNKIPDGTLFPYMQTIVMVQSKFKSLSEEEILERYENLTKITDYKIDQAKNNPKIQAKLKKTKKDIDEWLLKIIKPDCNFVKNNLAPKFRQNPDDLLTAKRIFTYMLQGKCTEDPIWLESGEAIFAKENDFSLGKILALRFLAQENNTKAESYFNKTLTLAINQTDSSEIYYYKGTIETKKEDKQKAREYFLISAKLDSKRKDAYERIGDLYLGSFSDCAQKKRHADDRAIYLAAYEYYAKAGNSKKMSIAKQRFPSREEIFEVNYKMGDKIIVGCWINEAVVISTRD